MALKMSFAFGGEQIACGNRAAETICRGYHLQRQCVISAERAHGFSHHRQHMGTDINDDTVRVAKLAGIRLTGGKIQRNRFSRDVEAARLLKKSFDFDDLIK